MLGVVPLAAHPFHASLTEAELNPETGRLEVALKLPTRDLERALHSRKSEPVDLEGDQDDDAILAYLGSIFLVRCNGGEPATLTWVGKEVEVKTTWLYFELALPKEPAGCSIENRLLFDLEPTQLNTLRLRAGSLEVSVNLTRENPRVSLR